MSSVKSKTGLKRKHVTLTIKNKLKVIERLEKGLTGKVIADEFGISRQTVSDIKKRTDRIKEYALKYDVTNAKSIVSRRKTLKRPKDDVLERALYKWYKKQESNGVAVSNAELQTTAENLSKQLVQGVTCTPSWLGRFRYRYGINVRRNKPETISKSVACTSVDNVESDEQNEEMYPLDVIVKEEEQIWDNDVNFNEIDGRTVLNAARDGIEAVINYVGYSSNRELWSVYEHLRTVKEIIMLEQKKMLAQTVPSDDFTTPELNTQVSAASESSTD